MDQYDYQDKFAEELAVWGNLDGCEGGDFLHNLAGAINTAHYNYAGEDEVLHQLYWIALGELYWHIGGEIITEYQEPEYVAACARKIRSIWER